MWVPILRPDVESSVPQATTRLLDERVSHFWDGRGDLVKAYARVLQLGQGQPAWDVYLVFDRQVVWKDGPPAPIYWMHQLRGQPPEQMLDGDKLAMEINKLLQATKQ